MRKCKWGANHVDTFCRDAFCGYTGPANEQNELVSNVTNSQQDAASGGKDEKSNVNQRILKRLLHYKSRATAMQAEVDRLSHKAESCEESCAEFKRDFEHYKDEWKKSISEIARLKEVIIAHGLHHVAPCLVCGYDGEGYFQPDKHPCMKGYE